MAANPELRASVVDLVNKGFSCTEIGVMLSISMSRAFYFAKRYAGKTNPKHHRTHNFNQAYFSDINTEENAYWLGMIYSDGSLCVDLKNKSYAVLLGLQESDKKHLEKICDEIGMEKETILTEIPNRDIFENKTNFCRIAFFSKQMVGDLQKIGVTSYKSYDACYPTKANIPDHLERRFWRGMIDGDGWLYCSEAGKWNIGLCGTENMVISFRAFLTKIDPEILTRKIRFTGSTYEINYSCSWSQRVAKILYDNSSVYLERKYQGYLVLRDKLHRITRSRVSKANTDQLSNKNKNQLRKKRLDQMRAKVGQPKKEKRPLLYLE